jgi:hypothetical protein
MSATVPTVAAPWQRIKRLNTHTPIPISTYTNPET